MPLITSGSDVDARSRSSPSLTFEMAAGSAGSAATAPALYDLLQYGGEIPDPPDYVLSAAERAAATAVGLTGTYHNLLRLWADV